MLKTILKAAAALSILGLALPVFTTSASADELVYGTDRPAVSIPVRNSDYWTDDNGVVRRHYYRERESHYLLFPFLGYTTERNVPYDEEYVYVPPPPPRVYAYDDSHVNWCMNRYVSYDPATDTFMGYDGYRHRCVSAY